MLDLRLATTRQVKAIGSLVGSVAYSNQISVADTVAPTGGSLSRGSGSRIRASGDRCSASNLRCDDHLARIALVLRRFEPLGSGGEVMSLPAIGGLSPTIFGTPTIELINGGTMATVFLPVLAGQFFGQAQFTLTASDGAGNPYAATATGNAMTVTLQALPAPTTVSAIAGAVGSHSITIIMVPSFSGVPATGYNIYRGTKSLLRSPTEFPSPAPLLTPRRVSPPERPTTTW